MCIRDSTYKPGEGITGQVAQTGKPMVIANLGKDEHFLDRTGARRFLDRSELSFLCVPIIYDGKVVGVLSADKVAHQVDSQDYELRYLSEVASLIAKAVHTRAIEEENRRLRNILGRTQRPSSEIVGNAKCMREIFGLISQVADSNTTVLIHGETGTGKEVLANAIHQMGPRANQPFIAINCAAIQSTMLESELFGYEAGAFTGAEKRKHGLMEVADGGILFLDEISSIPIDMQAKLLRALEERAFRRVGGTNLIRVDVQILAASNRHLPTLMEDGRFREDLYYRLKVVDLHLPPLRERKEDIPELVGAFIHQNNARMGVNITDITPRAMQALVAYSWPGNIRELRNVIERAMLFCDCLLYTSPSPRDRTRSRMPSSA